jgi:hypothetical protein
MYDIIFLTQPKGVMNMMDNTLLDSTEPISMEALQAHFQVNDFSTMVSRYDYNKATFEQDALYTKARTHFRNAWNQEMHKLANKKSLMNFSNFHPVRHLEKREELLVAGTVMELLEDETQCEMLIDLVFDAMQEPLQAELNTYATAHNRAVDTLTEEELSQVLDQFADEFLSRMMTLLQQIQQVPEILQLSRRASAREDLTKTKSVNYDLINHYRRWNHLRTKTGELILMTLEMESQLPGDWGATIKESLDYGFPALETSEEIADQLLQAFVDTLDNDIDRQIMYMRADGKTQAEIATALGYANHSPVTKRLQRLKPKFESFMERMNGY